jgi:ribosome biogenesis GTPase A
VNGSSATAVEAEADDESGTPAGNEASAAGAGGDVWKRALPRDHVYRRSDLLAMFEALAREVNARVAGTEEEKRRERRRGRGGDAGKVVIGMVGYPNVGKSSTINALYGTKRVAVAATPGKTKNYQTLHLNDRVVLADCPGLVMPSFATTKADMICNGTLPINHMRDWRGPMHLVCERIPRDAIERCYKISLPRPDVAAGEDPHRAPTPEEVLSAHGLARGFMTGRGTPDHSRSARVVLKDYMNGRLLHCHLPPGVADTDVENYDRLQVNVLNPKETRRALDDTDDGEGGGAGAAGGSDGDRGKTGGRRQQKTGKSARLEAMEDDFFASKSAGLTTRGQGNAAGTTVVYKNKRAAAAHRKAMARQEKARKKAERAAAARASGASGAGG